MNKNDKKQLLSNGMQMNYFDSLPNEFNRVEAIEVAKKIDIREKTAESYLKIFTDKKLLFKPKHNFYSKEYV